MQPSSNIPALCKAICSSTREPCINASKHDYNGVQLCSLHYQVYKKKDECCSICLDPLTKTPTIKTNCGHLFHFSCLKGWHQQQHDSCPMCRQAMDAPTLYKLNKHMFDALGTLVYSLNPSHRSVMLSVIHHSVDEVLTSFTAQAQAQMQAHAQAQAQAHAHAQAQAEAMAQLQAHSQALTQLQVHAQAITQLQPVITTVGPPPPAPPPQALT